MTIAPPPIHEAANIFPMEEETLAELGNDIKQIPGELAVHGSKCQGCKGPGPTKHTSGDVAAGKPRGWGSLRERVIDLGFARPTVVAGRASSRFYED